MAVSAERLDALLHLGERITEAMDADDWERVADLLDRRARVAERLAQAEPGRDTGLSEAALRQKRTALADQHETLLARLRDREETIETELGQLQRLQRANDSYDDHAASPTEGGGHEGVLPPELSG